MRQPAVDGLSSLLQAPTWRWRAPGTGAHYRPVLGSQPVAAACQVFLRTPQPHCPGPRPSLENHTPGGTADFRGLCFPSRYALISAYSGAKNGPRKSAVPPGVLPGVSPGERFSWGRFCRSCPIGAAPVGLRRPKAWWTVLQRVCDANLVSRDALHHWSDLGTALCRSVGTNPWIPEKPKPRPFQDLWFFETITHGFILNTTGPVPYALSHLLSRV